MLLRMIEIMRLDTNYYSSCLLKVIPDNNNFCFVTTSSKKAL